MSQTKTRITCVSRVSLATIAPDPLLTLVKYDDTLGDLQSLYISTGDNREFFSQRHLGQWRQFSGRIRGKGNIMSCCCCGEIVMISFGLNRWLIRSYSNSLQVVTFDLVPVPDQPLKKYKTATTTGVLGSSSSRMMSHPLDQPIEK